MKPVDWCCTPDSDHNLVAAKLIVLLETNLRFPGRVTSKENSVLLWKIFVLNIGSEEANDQQRILKHKIESQVYSSASDGHGVWKTEQAENYFITSSLLLKVSVILYWSAKSAHEMSSVSGSRLVNKSWFRFSVIIFETSISSLLAQLWRTSPHRLDRTIFIVNS